MFANLNINITCGDVVTVLFFLGLILVLCRFGIKEAERGKFGPQYGLKWKREDKDGESHGP